MLNSIKTALSDALGISKDALHIHIGLALFVALAFVLRGRVLLPWLAVLLLQLGNEVLDLVHEHELELRHIVDSARDTLNTMLWPTVAALLFRRMRRTRA